MARVLALVAGVAVLFLLLTSFGARAEPPIRDAFFTVYPMVDSTRLDDLPSHVMHCGVCHLDFNGGGPRNHYGHSVEIAKRQTGADWWTAFTLVENEDPDFDGFPSIVEITDFLNFGNTPTFPGVNADNLFRTANVDTLDVYPYRWPSGGSDTTPPAVHVNSPNGGGVIAAGAATTVTYTATDASGINHVNVSLSEDGGLTYRTVGRLQSPTGSFSWWVPSLPGTHNRIRVEAVDKAGNAGSDASDADFTITAVTGGRIASTLRDVKLPGTQPFDSGILRDPFQCVTLCHGNYSQTTEPWFNWRGSMMSQSIRDPLFRAALAIAEQDAPSAGNLCLRCHAPGGWQEGRAADPGGGMLSAIDRNGVQCDFCHRMLDWDYQAGTSPPEDQTVLARLAAVPFQYANGECVSDRNQVRRGPFSDAQASHQFLQSDLHTRGDFCSTCHDVSNPLFRKTAPNDYVLGTLDQPHADGNLRNMFPNERLASEWSRSEYATTGVYAPQFAGTLPGGIVSTCQDCHMRDVIGYGCNRPGTPARFDLPLHDLTGANTFVPGLLRSFYPAEVDTVALNAGKARATSMLQLAASLALNPNTWGVSVRVTNETGHKLPSGFPEGRRMWLYVKAVDAAGATVFQSGVYDAATATLVEDPQLRVYECRQGISGLHTLATGLPLGPSFHFALNDTTWFDNRIPPRGFTNAGFAEVQAAPVGHSYADGQYWDDVQYYLPAAADTVHVTLYYQVASREYVEFLRDANTTNSAGQDLYDAWANHGKSAPVAMKSAVVPVSPDPTAVTETPPTSVLTWGLEPGRPSPFREVTELEYAVAERAAVRLSVYDLAGRRVRVLVDGVLEPDRYRATWDGRDDRGRRLASGIYFVRYEAGPAAITRRVIRLN